MKKIIRHLLFSAMFPAVFLIAADAAADWKLPPDGGTLSREEVNVILTADDFPESTAYERKIEYLDFTSYGQKFTQVVVTLHPKQPRMHRGKKLVVVGGEPGSEYAMDFLETPEGSEGMGVWLAKRGVTFVALTRIGRWNFLDRTGNGSWREIPLESRMPIYHSPVRSSTTRRSQRRRR